MSGEEVQKAFDEETASSVVKELRDSFGSGKTRRYEWRVSQVKALLKAVVENEQQIVDALRSDLAKPPLETVVYEIISLITLHELDDCGFVSHPACQ
ncbi:hypothetical protein VNO78_01529 [Psophocarpus tetragonolobus]|uniref:Uncharacterized protein n=1 Tax=Psophocarpus tetragonolobus TaxID=3891 RepID=A0AAN9T1U5_PSOTE